MSFHVPERWRLRDGPMRSGLIDGNNGAFAFDSPEPGWVLQAIACDGKDPEAADWEHVSITARQKKRSRVPTWREMCFVKELFWDAEDVVWQIHPRRSEYVNTHPDVLHLWRHRTLTLPTPPTTLV